MSAKFRLPGAVLLLLLPGAAQAEDREAKWGAWIDGGAFYSSRDESRGESTLWAPLWQSPSSVFFFEGQGKIFEESQKEGNFALAYREMLASGWNLGAWGGYDIRSTSLGNRFNQISGGVEALSTNWDVRVNGYLPLNDSELVSESSQQIGSGSPTILLNGSSLLLQTGSILSTSRLSELAFGGVDAEIGLRLPVEALSIDPQAIDLRIYGGGFYFDNSDADQAIAGPKARAELRINDIIGSGSRLTLEAAYTSDDVRGELFEGGARLRIPLGEQPALASLSLQDQRMSEQLRRDTDIVSSTKTKTSSVNTLTTETVLDAATGVDLTKVSYVDPTTSGGITGVSAAEGANTLIIANGAFNANTVLQSAQTLLGGGGSITLKGKSTGTQVQFTASGAAATITSQVGGYAITGNSDVHVAGLTIDGTAGIGAIIVGAPANNIVTSNVVVDHNTIIAPNNDAIVAGPQGSNSTTDRITIADNFITAADNGVNIFRTTNAVIRDNVISAAAVNGILAQIGTSNIEITGNTIASSGGKGIVVAAIGTTGIVMQGNTINTQGGILILGSGNDGTISNNTFNSQGWEAIAVVGNNNTYQGADNVQLNGSACANGGSNPGMAVGFTNGAHCP